MTAITYPFRRVGRFSDDNLPILFLVPGLLCLALVIVYPIAYNVYAAFTDANLMYPDVNFVGLENFQATLRDPLLGPVVLTSLVWTFGTVGGQLLVGLVAALALDRVVKGRTPIRLMLIVPWAFPTIVMAYSWRFMLDGTFGVINHLLMVLGLIDQPVSWISQPALAMPIVILVSVWHGFPFMTVTILSAMATIPDELYEAARIDGANYWQEVRFVTLPFIAPILLSVLTLRTIWTFNGFDLIFLMTGGGPVEATTTLPIYAFGVGWLRYDVGRMASISLFMILILAAIIAVYFLAFQRKAR